jgi:hypothetical protein
LKIGIANFGQRIRPVRWGLLALLRRMACRQAPAVLMVTVRGEEWVDTELIGSASAPWMGHYQGRRARKDCSEAVSRLPLPLPAEFRAWQWRSKHIQNRWARSGSRRWGSANGEPGRAIGDKRRDSQAKGDS